MYNALRSNNTLFLCAYLCMTRSLLPMSVSTPLCPFPVSTAKRIDMELRKLWPCTWRRFVAFRNKRAGSLSIRVEV